MLRYRKFFTTKNLDSFLLVVPPSNFAFMNTLKLKFTTFYSSFPNSLHQAWVKSLLVFIYILDICWDILVGFEKRCSKWCDEAVPNSCITCHAFSGLVMKPDGMLPLIQHSSAASIIYFLTVLQYCLFPRCWSQPWGSPVALSSPPEYSWTSEHNGVCSTVIWVCTLLINKIFCLS